MTGIWALAALWLGLALIASLLSIWLRDLDRAVRDHRRHDRATDHRRRHRLGGSRHRRDLDQVPVRPRRHRPHFPGRGRARSRRVQAQMEGGRRPSASSASSSRSSVAPPAAYFVLGWEPHAELARRRRHVDDLGRRGLRRDARVRLEHDGVRQDRARRLLHHRSRHGRRSRPHLRAFHRQDADLSRRWRGRVRHSPLGDAALLSSLWQPAVGARDQIPAASASWAWALLPPGPTAKRCFPPI